MFLLFIIYSIGAWINREYETVNICSIAVASYRIRIQLYNFGHYKLINTYWSMTDDEKIPGVFQEFSRISRSSERHVNFICIFVILRIIRFRPVTRN